MKYLNLDRTEAFNKLSKLSKDDPLELKDLVNEKRVNESECTLTAGVKEKLIYNWACKKVNDRVINALQELSDEQELINKYTALLEGEIINTGENRMVLHHLNRSPDGKSITGKNIVRDSRDLGEFYKKELERFSAFAEKIRSGEIIPGPGKKYTAFCQIGIGGSDLGPRALSLALENWAIAEGVKTLRAEFISNVDPDDASRVVSTLPLDETLFILVSKSGTTQETLTNELFVKEKIAKAGLDPSKHMIAVTSETSPLANNPVYLDSFYFDDYIGGRYSSTSGVGGLILSLAYGSSVFKDFLAGANSADKAALEKDIRKNAALMDALIGVWERNFLFYPSTAILPYSQALSRFPAHLQQLDMESNGKRVNREGKPINYSSGPVIFGEPGTNGQHSFYQLLHQGTDIVPLQFIGFKNTQRKDDSNIGGSTSQEKLNANLAAQIKAFAHGKSDSNSNKDFPGERPSSLIYGDRLTPWVLGALLAHYENKVMFQGFIWNLNSFDQEGVQLGKVLAGKVLNKSEAGGKSTGDPVLDAYSGLLGV